MPAAALCFIQPPEVVRPVTEQDTVKTTVPSSPVKGDVCEQNFLLFLDIVFI